MDTQEEDNRSEIALRGEIKRVWVDCFPGIKIRATVGRKISLSKWGFYRKSAFFIEVAQTISYSLNIVSRYTPKRGNEFNGYYHCITKQYAVRMQG